MGHEEVAAFPRHFRVAVFHGDGADGEPALGAHLEHAHFVLEQVRPAVSGAFRENDHAQRVLDALLDLHTGGLAAFWTRPVDPDGSHRIAAPSDDGPALDFGLGHEDERVGGRHHDRIDVAAVVGDEDAGVVRQFALYRYPNARCAMNRAAEPRVWLVQPPVVRAGELSGECAGRGRQGDADEGK